MIESANPLDDSSQPQNLHLIEYENFYRGFHYSGMRLMHFPTIPDAYISLFEQYPDSKVHGANMGPIWGRQDPGGPHVGPMNFAIWVANLIK